MLWMVSPGTEHLFSMLHNVHNKIMTKIEILEYEIEISSDAPKKIDIDTC